MTVFVADFLKTTSLSVFILMFVGGSGLVVNSPVRVSLITAVSAPAGVAEQDSRTLVRAADRLAARLEFTW